MYSGIHRYRREGRNSCLARACTSESRWVVVGTVRYIILLFGSSYCSRSIPILKFAQTRRFTRVSGLSVSQNAVVSSFNGAGFATSPLGGAALHGDGVDDNAKASPDGVCLGVQLAAVLYGCRRRYLAQFKNIVTILRDTCKQI